MSLNVSDANHAHQNWNPWLMLQNASQSAAAASSGNSAQTTSTNTNAASASFDSSTFLQNFADLFGQSAAAAIQNSDGSINNDAVVQFMEQALGGSQTTDSSANASATSDDADTTAIQSAFQALLGNLTPSASTADASDNSSAATNAQNPFATAQAVFKEIDANGDGEITQTELENAVVAGGGTKADADTLYSQLDPNNTGSVSEKSFVNALAPPPPHGHHMRDADNSDDTDDANSTATADASTATAATSDTASASTSATNVMTLIEQILAANQAQGAGSILYNYQV